MSRSLLEVLRNVTLDPGEHAAFSADPAGYLAQFGYEDVPAEHLAEAFSLVADTLPADVAQNVSPSLLEADALGSAGSDLGDEGLLLADDLSTATGMADTPEASFGAVTNDFDDDTAGDGFDTSDDTDDVDDVDGPGGELATDDAGTPGGEDDGDVAGPGGEDDRDAGALDAARFGFGEGSDTVDGGPDDVDDAASPIAGEGLGDLDGLDDGGSFGDSVDGGPGGGDLADLGTDADAPDFGAGGSEDYDDLDDGDDGLAFTDTGDDGGDFDIDDVGAF